MTSVTSNLTIYPVYCHDLSPTIGKWCPLRAVDVHKLQSVGMVLDGRPLYHYGNHPIKWVRLTGVVVAIDDNYQRRVYTLDDSSGECIECTCKMPLPLPLLPPTLPIPAVLNQRTEKQQTNVSNPEKAVANNANGGDKDKPKVVADGVDVGSVVKVKGRVSEVWGMKQIEISSVVLMRGTEEEVRCWNESLEFRRDVLSKPWVVEPRKEEKMRKRSLDKMVVKRKVKDGEVRRKAKEGKGKSRDKQVLETGLMIDGTSEAPEKKRKSHHVQRMTEEEELLLGSKRQKDNDRTGLNLQNKDNHPSIALRKKFDGKYDALGI